MNDQASYIFYSYGEGIVLPINLLAGTEQECVEDSALLLPERDSWSLMMETYAFA